MSEGVWGGGVPGVTDDSRFHATIQSAITAGRQRLLADQHESGYWLGELEGSPLLESEYIMLRYMLGRGNDPRLRKAATTLIRKQRPDGGWSLYPGGPPELNVSIQAYFSLKLLGTAPDEPFMRRARDVILELGGVERTNSLTKVFLAVFDQYNWRRVPVVPPELILLPRWSSLNIHEMSAWARTIIVPLSIIRAHTPRYTLPDSARLDELFTDHRPPTTDHRPSLPWRLFFRSVDRLIKAAERSPLKPWRRRALQAASEWMIAHCEGSDGLGALFPSIVYSIIAMGCLDYPDTHPHMIRAVRDLEKLVIEEEETLRFQLCLTPVWDTALSILALHESGLPADHPTLVRGASWLLGREVTSSGDWQMKVYTYSEARRRFASILEQAQKEGGVRIRRKDGQIFIIKPESPTASPLDVEGVPLEVTTEEIVAFIHESRRGA